MARIRLYVDYENVQTEGLRGISKLNPCCTTNIIYSKKAERVRMSEVMELMSAGSEIRFFEAENGTPNALDFQLLTLMFIDYARGGGDVFVVISRDSGYDCAIRAAKSLGVKRILRCTGIGDFLQVMPLLIKKMQGAAWKNNEADEITEEDRGTKDQRTETYEDWGVGERVFGSARPDGDGLCDTTAAEEKTAIGDTNDERDVTAGTPGTDKRPDGRHGVSAGDEKGESGEIPLTNRIQQYLYAKKGVLYSDGDCRIIGEALANSENKMQFYQYFQKKSGKNGVEFYRKIRGEYDALAEL